ncbi:MAG: hypothetical protein D3X82_13930 [Candidatus Leucobacter sulfamidivorax]|nr:hypothetical protein [Candidatus Leucobacter sulfamidivorax]
MTPIPNPTAEQIIADAITAYWADEERSGPNRGPNAHDRECGIDAAKALRAHSLLSEVALSDEQIARASLAVVNLQKAEAEHDTAIERAEAAEATVGRVRAKHVRQDDDDEPYCGTCFKAPYGYAPWPCLTVAALAPVTEEGDEE